VTTLHRVPSFAAVAIVALVLAACGPSAVSPSASGSEPGASPSTAASQPSVEPTESTEATESAEPSDEDLGPFACDLPVTGVGSTVRAQIVAVRVGEHDGYDRIVWEFEAGIPEFSVEAATPPFTQDASGLPLEVEGEAFLKIVLQGGTRQHPDGGTTFDGPTEFPAGFPKLVELIGGGDFEAVSTWYAGMTDTACVRVITTADPARLIIDLEH
jgi:hypothetical protein